MIYRIKEYYIELIAFAAFVTYAGILNLQFLEGSNVNYTFSGHDEYLTVREVYSILNPASWKHFALSVAAGDVFFYGRAMFYIDALMAWLPYKIWGLAGMVFAIRMAHVLYLIIAVILLGKTFLSKTLSRLSFYLIVLTWYYTTYFVMIPKPEPLQLLIMAVFLFYSKKVSWQFGKHYVLLGIAYGLKFNVLMILPIFFGIPIITRTFKLKEAIVSIVYFLFGIVVAIPSLLLFPIKPVYLKFYLASTFGNTKHYDDTSVSFLDWLNNGLFQWYGGNSITGAIIFLAFILLVFWLVYRLLMMKELNSLVILSGMAICFLMPVMLLTKRLWPHYLWTGSVLMILSVFAFIDSLQIRDIIKNISKYTMLACTLLVSVSSIIRLDHVFYLESDSKEIISSSIKAQNYISTKSNNFICAQDISVFLPFDDFVSSNRYHPFSTEYPYQKKQRIFSTTKSGFVNPKELFEMKANYLVTYRTDFESIEEADATKRNEIINKYNSQLRAALLDKSIVKDTFFGKVKVYRILVDDVK
ncbi:MAG: hypothetical protein AB7O73_01485 [Bacteroidia bacterium]